MKLPRSVNGDQLAKHLERHWSYVSIRQSGSHLRMQTTEPNEHLVTIPMHRPIKTGTLSGILKEIAAHKSVDVETVLEGL